MSDSELKAKFKAVEKAWATAHKTQEEKLALATATYEMVDRHIRRLDSDLSRFESEIAERGGLETNTPTGFNTLKKLFLLMGILDHRKVRPAGDEGGDQQIQIAPQDVLDMPVDPNEPTYCLCHQVSYGEMIGCDNPDVSFL